jgi:hypothetical protein
MIHSGIEGFDGCMDGDLDTDKDADTEDNPDHRE